MTGRIARSLVRMYPPEWRARYEGEVLALLEEIPPTTRDLFDLARGVVREWTRKPVLRRMSTSELSEINRRHGQRMKTLFVLGFAIASVGWLVASWLYDEGYRLASSPSFKTTFIAALVLRGLPLFILSFWQRYPRPLAVTRVEFAAWIPAIFGYHVLNRLEPLSLPSTSATPFFWFAVNGASTMIYLGVCSSAAIADRRRERDIRRVQPVPHRAPFELRTGAEEEQP
jgi:hypothetical protein